jgi:membrane fusion protein (multidrug efflux system)
MRHKEIRMLPCKEDALLVPQPGVSRDQKGTPYALVVNAAGKVEQRMLTLDRAIGDRWLISSGLDPGDRVIVEGVQKARPGLSVKAVPLGPDQEDRPAVEPSVQHSTSTN